MGEVIPGRLKIENGALEPSQPLAEKQHLGRSSSQRAKETEASCGQRGRGKTGLQGGGQTKRAPCRGTGEGLGEGRGLEATRDPCRMQSEE